MDGPGALRRTLVIFDCDGVLVDSEPISNGVLAQMLTEQGMSTTMAEAKATYQGMLLQEVLATIGELLAGGQAICVASQGRLEKTDRSLSLTGLAELIDESWRFSAEQVPRGKPHPDLFLLAARTMGFEPSECVVVEDTLSGVAAGRSAGMRVLGYAGETEASVLERAGAEVVLNLGQIPPRIAATGREA